MDNVKRDAWGNEILAEVNGYRITRGEFCYDLIGKGRHLVSRGNLNSAIQMAEEN